MRESASVICLARYSNNSTGLRLPSAQSTGKLSSTFLIRVAGAESR
jgi:hypothetical protein